MSPAGSSPVVLYVSFRVSSVSSRVGSIVPAASVDGCIPVGCGTYIAESGFLDDDEGDRWSVVSGHAL